MYLLKGLTAASEAGGRCGCSECSRGQALHAEPSQQPDVAALSTFSLCSLARALQISGRIAPQGSWLTAAMQCNAVPQSWATPDRSRSLSENVHFQSCSGRLHIPQAKGLAPLQSHPESMGSEELAARQHSACHAGPSGRVSSLLTLSSCTRAP